MEGIILVLEGYILAIKLPIAMGTENDFVPREFQEILALITWWIDITERKGWANIQPACWASQVKSLESVYPN